MFNELIKVIKGIYPNEDPIPLHRPIIDKSDEVSVLEALRSGYVSSVGKDIVKFETEIKKITSTKHAIAVSSGTSALHISLHALGVGQDDLVLTQSLSFAATTNAILQCGASPVYIDINEDHWSLCPAELENWLVKNTKICDDQLIEKTTQRRISACIPMHTFGIPANIIKIKTVCNKFNIPVVEDAAEALGSKFNGVHCGTIGDIGIISFNGNKIITTGAGGIVLTNSDLLEKRIRHLSTTAKVSHQYEYVHDELGFNYRMSNLNASLGLSQIKKLNKYIDKKKSVFDTYKISIDRLGYKILTPPYGTQSNNWLNTIIFNNKSDKTLFIDECLNKNIHVRPVWKPLHTQKHMRSPIATSLQNTLYLYDHAVCLPSSIPLDTTGI